MQLVTTEIHPLLCDSGDLPLARNIMSRGVCANPSLCNYIVSKVYPTNSLWKQDTLVSVEGCCCHFMWSNAHAFQTIFAVCIYRYVVTLGLRSKYDADGHYFIFQLWILDIMSCRTLSVWRCSIWHLSISCRHYCYVTTYRSCIVCNHLITSGSHGKKTTISSTYEEHR